MAKRGRPSKTDWVEIPTFLLAGQYTNANADSVNRLVKMALGVNRTDKQIKVSHRLWIDCENPDAFSGPTAKVVLYQLNNQNDLYQMLKQMCEALQVVEGEGLLIDGCKCDFKIDKDSVNINFKLGDKKVVKETEVKETKEEEIEESVEEEIDMTDDKTSDELTDEEIARILDE